MTRLNHALSSLAVAVLLAACGGGSDDSTPPVTVAAPVITTEPISSTANVGGTVTLSVVASGTGLSYQWQLNGTNIAGATSSTYTTPVLAAGDTGKSYTVVVTNSAGTDTSVAAVLTVNPVAAAAIELNQASANQLVADVNAGVSQLRQADALDRLPLPFGARIATLPLGAVVTQSVPCGTGSMSFSMTVNDSTQQPESGSMSFNNCGYTVAGYSSTFSGAANLTISGWTNENNFTMRVSYDMSYTASGPGYADSGTVAGVQTCTFSGENVDCGAEFGNDRVSNVTLTNTGSTTTVQAGRISNTEIDCVYSNWSYDSSTGRATTGTVTVTAPNGDRAVITATSTGYTVVITVGTTTQTFTVALAA